MKIPRRIVLTIWWCIQVGVVVNMINTSRSMRCYTKGAANSALAQFSCFAENENDSGDGGGISVFTFWPVSHFGKLIVFCTWHFDWNSTLVRISWFSSNIFYLLWSTVKLNVSYVLISNSVRLHVKFEETSLMTCFQYSNRGVACRLSHNYVQGDIVNCVLVFHFICLVWFNPLHRVI